METIATELMAQDNTGSPIEQIERATVDVQISTAKRYPRVISTVKKDILTMATMDVETAESCFYKLPRGGKNIEGPSIRLAEIALSCYGNLRAATRVVSTHTGENPHVIIQAVCHDLEKNNSVSIEKRRRITKKKSRDNVDEDDINLATNACSAIALRDAIFKIVPGVIVKPVLDAAKRVAIGDASTLVDRRARAMYSLQQMGVQPDRIFSVLEVKAVEDINIEHLETLSGLRTAVKDGQITIDEAFPAPVATNKTAGAVDPKALFGSTPTAPVTPPASAPAPAAAAPADVAEGKKEKKKPAEEKTPAPAPAPSPIPDPPSETPDKDTAFNKMRKDLL